ncbi:glycerophosphodiester phosphodiesterase family protein [uncultured Gemmiger sp.]|uniref:glycerophosphodiester phosphodiesterase family protein n=1 Tax=uncultured Gemmiger sp. TaxID=1623490 RepID=UPI002600241E|nr:glycerophosphodiester phosphodiesterase family protein [uncultured Gemmiger sp.]
MLVCCIVLLACAALVCAGTLFLVCPSRGRRALRPPFAGWNYAHRGLFARDQSTPENSLPAFAAAVNAGYGIELDVQFTSDRQLVVFHDDTLDRMTGVHGWVRDFTWQQVSGLRLAGTAHHPPLFSQALDLVEGRVPLIVEIKSRASYSGAYLDALCRAVLDQLQGYAGCYCIESFDPRVVRRIRKFAPHVLRGQLADSTSSFRREGAGLVPAFVMSHLAGNFLGRPDFIAWCPAPRNSAVRLARRLGAMMLYWTALPTDDTARLEETNDAVIFQWYLPSARYQK